MGMSQTHYVMAAVKLEPVAVKALFQHPKYTEGLLENYHDNGYSEEITVADGLTLVVDGCNGEYAMFGVVLAKGIESGLDVTLCSIKSVRKKMGVLRGFPVLSDITKKVAAILEPWDQAIPRAKIWAFTHWH